VALAQTVLGLCYKHGRGVYRDAAMAIRYFRLGSDGGNGEAACCVGDCYKEGFGVAFNMQQAVRYYRLAAERDHCRGQCIYADYLEEGRGTSKVDTTPQNCN
jgi:TPR repeat protein